MGTHLVVIVIALIAKDDSIDCFKHIYMCDHTDYMTCLWEELEFTLGAVPYNYGCTY